MAVEFTNELESDVAAAMKLRLAILIVFLSIFTTFFAANAQNPAGKALLVLGGKGALFYEQAASLWVRNRYQNSINILIFPFASTPNSDIISAEDKSRLLANADEIINKIQILCQNQVEPGTKCSIKLAPIFSRQDAFKFRLFDYFTDPISAVLVIEGDPSIASKVITGTPVEDTLNKLFEEGVVIAGSAGLLSRDFISGYTPAYSINEALQFNAIDFWNTDTFRGLSFGLQNAVLEQELFSKNNLPRLLNAISLPGSAQVGIGFDSYTGAAIIDNRLQNIFGSSTICILDAETYHASDLVTYHGPQNFLSLRNVLFHILSPGEEWYDLENRWTSLGSPRARIERQYSDLLLPQGAGALILTGNLHTTASEVEVLSRFVNYSGGSQAYVMILAAGYLTEQAAQEAGNNYAQIIGVPSQVILASDYPTATIPVPAEATGILFTAANPRLLEPRQFQNVASEWKRGTPLLADGAAAALIGREYVASPSFASDEQPYPELIQNRLTISATESFQNGLGLIPIQIEPHIFSENSWSRLIPLAYRSPKNLSLGLADRAALMISKEGAFSLGEGQIFIFDLRNARLSVGENQMITFANGLIDVFAPGEVIAPVDADINLSPLHIPTPFLTPEPPTPTQTPTLTPTFTPSPTTTETPDPSKATRTPRPTRTPVPIPPSADIGRTNAMIGLSILAVVVVIFGVWLNRRRFG